MFQLEKETVAKMLYDMRGVSNESDDGFKPFFPDYIHVDDQEDFCLLSVATHLFGAGMHRVVRSGKTLADVAPTGSPHKHAEIICYMHTSLESVRRQEFGEQDLSSFTPDERIKAARSIGVSLQEEWAGRSGVVSLKSLKPSGSERIPKRIPYEEERAAGWEVIPLRGKQASGDEGISFQEERTTGWEVVSHDE